MKKFAFSLVLVFLASFLFAQTASDYDKILKGDLSAFAGYWLNGNNDLIVLQSNGANGKEGEAGNYNKGNGVYSWWIPFAGAMLFPVGVETPNVRTDTTKVRLTMGQAVPGTAKEYYYKVPATHVVTINKSLREYSASMTILAVNKGTQVLVYQWGNAVTIDGISGKWALIVTSDGSRGWYFSGYLEEIKK
jgi:hypothetical protein